MLMDKHWRVTQPELHKFARRISDLFPVGSRRDWLVTQLCEYKSAGERFVESEIKWRNDRRAYFEEELPKQPASFRNQNACDHQSLVWDTYERLLDSQQDIDDVSTKLRRATCVRLWPDKSGHLVPTRMRCFTDHGDGTGSVNVVGWIPRDLFKFDDCHKPSSPLPPSKLKGGRGYTVPEICYGLAVIHDADGSFSPFAAEGSAIGDLLGFEFWFMEARIRGTEMAMWRAANDDWLVSLEPLFAQVSSAIESREILRELTDESVGAESPQRFAPSPAQDGAEGVERACTEMCGETRAHDGDPSRFAHSDDFRSVLWDGQPFCFTEKQARVIEVAWRNWERRTPDVSDDTLLAAADPDCPPDRLNVLFRNSAAWNLLLVKGGSKGTHRIADPPSD